MRKLKLEELQRPTVDEFRQLPKTPIVLVLDNIRSGLNVGSAFRTADGFALERVVLCGITAQPPHREILKTAIGATDSIPWTHHASTTMAVSELRAAGYRIVAVEQAAGSVSLADFRWTHQQPIALVFGNEVRGVGQEVMDQVDACLEVPQYGTKHSFNISVCVGIVVWELFRQWKWPSL